MYNNAICNLKRGRKKNDDRPNFMEVLAAVVVVV